MIKLYWCFSLNGFHVFIICFICDFLFKKTRHVYVLLFCWQPEKCVPYLVGCSILAFKSLGGRRARDRVAVGFTTTYPIGAYHQWCCWFEFRSGWDVQHDVIKFGSDLRQVSGFLRVLQFPPPMKTDRHDITEILLKVALNTINHNPF